VSITEDKLLRPLRKTSHPGEGTFGTLLPRAVNEPDLACGFAFAYESLDVTGRRQFLENVIDDAKIEGIDVTSLLASLLAVEEEADLARLIASKINVTGGKGLQSSVRAFALLAGDEERGGVVLVRPLFGSFVEVYALAWNSENGVTHALFDPIVNATQAAEYKANLPDELAFEKGPARYAVDLMAKVLWNHRKHIGPLPPQIGSFADLFLGEYE
jgi:hypothetical protein